MFHNQMASLPAGISALSRLALLNTFANQLVALPPTISGLAALTKLDVSRNNLEALPDLASSLVELHLLQNRLRVLPDSICNLWALRKLDCSNNLLYALPAGLGSLSSLACLDAFQNRIEDMPPSMSQLHSLERLNLGRNEVSGAARCPQQQRLRLRDGQQQPAPRFAAGAGRQQAGQARSGEREREVLPGVARRGHAARLDREVHCARRGSLSRTRHVPRAWAPASAHASSPCGRVTRVAQKGGSTRSRAGCPVR